MKKNLPSKIISLLMALMLVFSVAAVSALADESEDSSDSSTSSGESSTSSDESKATPEPSVTPEATTAPNTDITVPEASSDFYIYDESNLLSAETKKAILDKNKELYEKYGVQIVVMSVKDLEKGALNAYSNEVFKKWKIGGDSENGVILVLDITNNTYYSMVGDGIKGAYADESLQTVLDTYLETDFADKKYDSGVKKFFDETVKLIETYATEQSNTSKTGKTDGGSIWGGIGIFLLIVVIVVAVLVAIIYVHGRMVQKKRQAARAARAARRRSIDDEAPSSDGGRLPDDLTSYHSSGSSKYDFDEFKPRK